MDINLCSLTDIELISRLEALVRDEREVTQKVVRHLAEVEVRRLYAKLGFTSLFDYATRGLGYSTSGAMRRIKAARVGAKVEKVYDYLESGELNLSTVDVLADLVDEGYEAEMVELFLGKSRTEAERIASRFRPVARREARDRIKPVVVGSAVDVRQEGLFENPSKDLVISAAVVDNSCEEKFQITFTVGAEFMEQLERMKELVFRGEKEELELENVFSQAMEVYTERSIKCGL